MTRNQVQIALFAIAAWLVTLAASIVLAAVVRAPLELPWVVTAWLIGMTVAGVGIAAGLLYLVVVDVVRAGRPAPSPSPSPLEELPPEEDLDPEDQAGSTGDINSEAPLEPAGRDPEVLVPGSGGSGSGTGLGPVVPIPPGTRPGPPPPPAPEPAERLSRAPYRS